MRFSSADCRSLASSGRRFQHPESLNPFFEYPIFHPARDTLRYLGHHKAHSLPLEIFVGQGLLAQHDDIWAGLYPSQRADANDHDDWCLDCGGMANEECAKV